MKYYYMTNRWTGEKKRVWFERDSYANNNSLYLELMCDEGPYTTVTVNLSDYHLEKNEAFVDTNNNPGIDAWLYKRGIASPTVVHGRSGFCSYPMMRFNLEMI